MISCLAPLDLQMRMVLRGVHVHTREVLPSPSFKWRKPDYICLSSEIIFFNLIGFT